MQEQIGQYRIESLIGSGGMGDVYRAHDTRRDREVALKLLPMLLSNDAEYQRRFQRESYAVARLREPHVIPIHDYGEIDGRLFIDMRLVDGPNLGAVIASGGPMEPRRAVAIVTQVADALDAAHADGVVHRDVKPSNILVTPSDFVYVVDFGIAHTVGHTRSRLTMTGATLGTLDYMAPERFENKPVDARTDVYSLACVLFECLTGTRPFAGDDLPALMYAHLHAPVPRAGALNPAITPELDAAVARGMAKDPGERPASAGAFAKAVRAALGQGAEERTAVVTTAAEADPGDATVVAPERVLAAAVPVGSGSGPAEHGGGSHPGWGAADGGGGHPAWGSAGGGDPGTPIRVGPGYGGVQPPRDPATSWPSPEGQSWSGAPYPAGATVAAASYDNSPTIAGTRRAAYDDGPVDPDRTQWMSGSPPASPPPSLPSPEQPRPKRRRLVVLLAVAVLLLAVIGIGAGYLLTRGGTTATATGGDQPNGQAGVPGSVPSAGLQPPVIADGSGPTAKSVDNPTVGKTVPVGATPGYMEIAPNGKYAYVANRAAGTLNLFDITSQKVIGTIPVTQGGPQFVAFAPDGLHAYVSIFNNERTVNLVGVLNTQTNTFEAMIPVGVRPFALEATPDGKKVYVPNHDSGSISVIDTATNTVINTITVAPNPHWVDITPDGSTLYAANHESNVVSVLNLANDTVTATIPVGKSPHSILRHPTKPLLFVVNYDGNSMSVIDTATNSVVKTVPTGNHPQDITLSADGEHIYIATVDDNAIQVYNVTKQEITASVPVGRSPTSISVGKDGRQAYVTNLADGTVTVLNLASTA